LKANLWDDYFDLLMEFEGTSYENDPRDPGGATKFGVDQRSHPGVDIRSLTRKGAEAIYLTEYAASAASKLPEPVNFVYFDWAVNAGESAAARGLQKALGFSRADGIVGPRTMAAANEMLASGQIGKLVQKISAARDLFYMNLAYASPSKHVFLKGWQRRAKAMLAWAMARMNDKEAA